MPRNLFYISLVRAKEAEKQNQADLSAQEINNNSANVSTVVEEDVVVKSTEINSTIDPVETDIDNTINSAELDFNNSIVEKVENTINREEATVDNIVEKNTEPEETEISTEKQKTGFKKKNKREN